MAENILRGGWNKVEFDDEGGDFTSPAVTMERLYGEVEFNIEDLEQAMADGTVAQAGVRVTATVRSADINPSNYAAIISATEGLDKMDVRFYSIKSENNYVEINGCSVRYGLELGAAGDFSRARVIINGFAHNIDDLLDVELGS